MAVGSKSNLFPFSFKSSPLLLNIRILRGRYACADYPQLFSLAYLDKTVREEPVHFPDDGGQPIPVIFLVLRCLERIEPYPLDNEKFKSVGGNNGLGLADREVGSNRVE